MPDTDTATTATATTATVTTGGSIAFADWKEDEAAAVEAGPRLARASVANTFTGGIEAARTTCEYTLAYAPGDTGVFTGLELVTGGVEGREGAFVLEHHGSFHPDGTIRCTFTVLPGTATGALTGLHGSGEYTCRPGEPTFAYAFRYGYGDGREQG
ncbi:DUF3224 domain-containing protein [Kitasatospora sp. NPDC088391]|uniref:DUF3224 domain-containing protein n=1 Tax=Kitasatospora sp. NPDC088391 TaxID=3364074 RepID=UPI0038247FBB